MKVYCYSKCSTCKKALQWLDRRKQPYELVEIKENPPTKNELKEYYALSGLPLKRFFNTSGNSYKVLELSKKFDSFSEDELLEMLSKDGMLIKRPLVVTKEHVLLGFKEKQWEEEF